MMAQPSPCENNMECLQKTKPEGIKPWFPGSNVYVLRLQTYQLNIKSHMKVHKITDDPDCVLCENTTGQWGPNNRTPEYVIWNVQGITKRKNVNRNNIPVCFKFIKSNDAFTPTAICRGKAIRSHSFPVRAGDLSRHDWQLPSATQHIWRRAEQWRDVVTLNVFIPGSHFHIGRHSHHREFYCYSLVSSHTVHDEVNCRESLSFYN